MRAGALDERITIQSAVITQDAIGNVIETWSDLMTVAASVQTSGGSEKYYSAALVSESTHKIMMRYYSAMETRGMRLIWRGRVLDILHIDFSRRIQGEMYLLAKELISNE